jgi:hypothetical protein
MSAGISANISDLQSSTAIITQNSGTFGDLKDKVVSILASGTNAKEIITDISTGYNISGFSNSEKGLFNIETSPDISDVTSVLVSQYVSTQQTLSSKTLQLGDNNVRVSIDKPSNSIYDSKLLFQATKNSEPFVSTTDKDSEAAYPTDINGTIPNSASGKWTATFDDVAKVDYFKAINSEHNVYDAVTKKYNRPLRVSNHDDFNKIHSLGKDTTHYFTQDSQTGEPLIHDISEEYTLDKNTLTFIKTDSEFSKINLDDCGKYKIQLEPDKVVIDVKSGDTNIASSIDKLPIFNSTSGQSLPTTLDFDTFFSFFNLNEENIVAGYEFNATINENVNSGYSPNQDMISRTDTTNTFTLDDTSLVDNVKYMDTFVNETHKLEFTNGTLSINSVGSANTANISKFTLGDERETLTSGLFNNGEIKVNNGSPTDRFTKSSMSNLDLNPAVYYSEEDVNKDSITLLEQGNSYVDYKLQLVAKNSDKTPSFLKSNKCSLDLFDGNTMVNELFGANAGQFRFDATNSSTNFDMEVVSIKPSRQIASINGFSSIGIDTNSQPVLTPVNFYTTLVKVQNLPGLINGEVFNTSKILFQLRNLTDLNIYNITTGGWQISSSAGNGKVVSSSLSGHAGNSLVWPSKEAVKNLINGSDVIDYSLEFNTVNSGSVNTRLSDSITINWKVRDTSSSNSFSIPQEMMTRIKNEQTSFTSSIITPSQYTLTGSLIGKTVQIKQLVSTRKVQYEFDPLIRVFIGLKMKTPDVLVKTTYYSLTDTTTGENLPPKFLQYVKKEDGSDYSEVNEQVISETPELSGSFDKTDFCDLMMRVEGKNLATGKLFNLTSNKPVSSMFGIEHILELNYENIIEKTGDISFSMECDYLSLEGKEDYITLDNIQNGYELQLTNDYKAEYVVENWSSKISNTDEKTFADNTDIANNDKYLSINNVYSNITTWSNDYLVDVTYGETKNARTNLKIYRKDDLTKAQVYSISTLNFTIGTPNFFISNIPKDIYRMVKQIGNSHDDAEITEEFMALDYTYKKNIDSLTQTNIIRVDSGIFVTKPGLTNSTFGLADIGKYIAFNLKGDLMGVNMIGSVAQMNELKYVSSTNNGLIFKYSNDGNNSKSLKSDYYRGFSGVNSVVQTYQLSRTTTTAKFSINTKNNQTIYQEFDVYYNSTKTVDSLSSNVGSIGLNIKFLASMLNNSDTAQFTIYNSADRISFNISNPEATSIYNPAPLPASLSQFSLANFSKKNTVTGKSVLAISPKRIKIRTTGFNYGTLLWSMKLLPTTLKISKNSDYLGNPEAEDVVWTEVTSSSATTYTFKNLFNSVGIPICKGLNIKKINSDNNNYSPFTCFFSIMPTYFKFQKVTNTTLTLPYTFSEETHLTSKYLPFSTEQSFKIHDITFVKSTTESMATILTNGLDSNFFVVEANKIKIQLFVVGVNEAINTLVDNVPANRLVYYTNDSALFYMPSDGLVNGRSGIALKMRQPIFTNTPYYPYLASSANLFLIEQNSANISFSIGNFFIPVTDSFDLALPAGAGTKAYLYTRQIVNSGSNIDMFVYRYKGINNFSTDNVDYDLNGANNITIYFNSREYIKKTVSSSDFNNFLNNKAMITKQDIIDGTVYDKFIAQQSIGMSSGINDVNWVADASWPTTDSKDAFNKNIFVSVTCFDDETKATVPGKIFAATESGKAFIYSKFPIIDIRNKLGQPHVTLTHDGTLITQGLSTSSVLLNKVNNMSTGTDFQNIFGSHQSGYSGSIRHPSVQII